MMTKVINCQHKYKRKINKVGLKETERHKEIHSLKPLQHLSQWVNTIQLDKRLSVQNTKQISLYLLFVLLEYKGGVKKQNFDFRGCYQV